MFSGSSAVDHVAGAQGEEAVTEQPEGHCFLPQRPSANCWSAYPVSVGAVRAQQGAELESSGAHTLCPPLSVRM